MAKIRSIAEFNVASARYAQATVKKANADGNAYLSKAEAQNLPKDLQDNFANYQTYAANGRAVSKEKFLESYEKYIAGTTAKADANHDGKLSATEAKNLPKDLQDNWANLWAAVDNAPAPGKSGDLQTTKQRLDSIYNKQLPKTDAFGNTARLLDQQLADQNIMSGVVGVASGKLANSKPTDADFQKWATTLMSDYLNVTQAVKAEDVKATVVDPKKGLKDGAKILAAGFAYDTSTPENIDSVLKGDPDQELLGIEEVTRQLGSPVKCVVVKGHLSEDDGHPWEVGMAAFLNTETGKFIAYYGREGDA